MSLLRLIVHVLAEWEARLGSRHGGWFRALELRSLGVKHGRQWHIAQGLTIWRRGGLLLGDRISLGPHTKIMNFAHVEIGDDFLGAGWMMINSGGHDALTLEPQAAPVVIGKRVWVGVGVTILAGVQIGDDAVIGAGSLVRGDVPEGAVVAGVPARVLRIQDRRGKSIWSGFPK